MSAASLAFARRDPLLIYRFDAALSLSSGLCLLFLAEPLAALVGWPPTPMAILTVGIFLLPWALFNWALGSAERPDRLTLVVNVILDALWVVASLALIAAHAALMTPIGLILLTAQAVAVLVVIVVKLTSLKAMQT